MKEIVQADERARLKNRVKLDVIAVGMKPPMQQEYASLAKAIGGGVLKVDQPTDLPSALAEYLQVSQTPKPEPIQVAGEVANYRISPGDEAKLPLGSYSIT